MPVKRRYDRPPVVEALCEVSFRGTQWDDTVPGLFYERIREKFPVRNQQDLREAALELGPTGEVLTRIRPMGARIRFETPDGSRLIQLSRNLLVVNQLIPYTEFSVWEPTIHEATQHYIEVAAPAGIGGIGLRYINRISIPTEKVKMEDYFQIYPQLPSGLGDEHGPFVMRVEIPRPGAGSKQHRVSITFGTATDGSSAGAEYMLDLYDTMKPAGHLQFDEFVAEVKAAQNNVESAFEGSITDKLRGLFRGRVTQ